MKNGKMFDLKSEYDSAKSFGGKAKVLETNNKNVNDLQLYSYNTLIATIDNNDKLIYLTDNDYHYSMTTCSHLKEFCLQNDIEYLGKAKMMQLATKIK